MMQATARAGGRGAGHLLAAIAFLTRLPVPVADVPLARAARWFPVAGAVVGGLSGAVLLVGSAVLPIPLAAGLAVAAGVLATGALHEDGLADTADGLGGGRTRERALEIMRDSRIGSYGALALVFSVALRWAAVAGMSTGEGALALVVAHAVSRGVLPCVPVLASYARPQGLGASFDAVRPADAAVALLLALAASLLAGGAGLIAFVLAVAAGGAMLCTLVRRLGGYTGDGLGAVQQVSELTVLLTLAGAA